MAHLVQCRLCKEKFDIEQNEFVLIGQKSYYHKDCYDIWIANRQNPNAAEYTTDFWYESVIDYLYRDVRMNMDFMKVRSQWNHFIKPEKKMTPKGIYFALRYFYEVMGGTSSKADGGIGIVPYIYKESAQYWTELESRKKGTLDAIIAQIQERKDRQVVNIKKDKKREPKVKWTLEEV